MRPFRDANQLIQFYLHRFGVAVLSVLDKKYHQKCNNGRARVDHQLPCITEPKQGAGDKPNQNDSGRDNKCSRPAGSRAVDLANWVNHEAVLVGRIFSSCVLKNGMVTFKQAVGYWTANKLSSERPNID